jgi:hypothetical protein
MSRARHHEKKHKASGGRAHEVVSGNPDVLKEAKGEESYDEGDERKRGGKVKKHVGMPEGKKAKHRMDRPMKGMSMMHKGRKSGGRVGSDKSPLSSAHKGGKTGEMSGGEPD